MAESRGVVIITVALIGAAATISAALIGRSDGGSATPPGLLPSTTLPFPPSDVATSPSQPPQPEPTVPEPTASPPPAIPGDLGLSRWITRPACDGRFVVFVGAAVRRPLTGPRCRTCSTLIRVASTCSPKTPAPRCGPGTTQAVRSTACITAPSPTGTRPAASAAPKVGTATSRCSTRLPTPA